MTTDEFTGFYPQFANFTPTVVLQKFIESANARFSDFSDVDRDEARRLFVAHKLTLYAKSALPAGAAATSAALANAGQFSEIAAKKVDDVEIRYSSGSSASNNVTGFADLDKTVYGLQLLSILRMYHGTRYIR